MKTVEVFCPNPVGTGGCRRALWSISYRCSLQDHCYLLPLRPHLHGERLTAGVAEAVEKTGGRASLLGLAWSPLDGSSLSAYALRMALQLAPLQLEEQLMRADYRRGVEADVVISHHETLDSLVVAERIAEETGARTLAILQLPPFYGDPARSRRVAEGILLYYELASRYAGSLGVLAKALYVARLSRLRSGVARKLVERHLGRFSLVVGVSPAIAADMGSDWADRVVSMRYWAGVSNKLVDKLRELRKRRREEPRERIVVYAGGLNPSKGLGDLLLAWRLVVRESRWKPRLVVTGGSTPNRLRLFKRIARGLGIADYVTYLGLVSSEDYWRIRSSACLTLHPSHEDSYSYTVFESLMLGIPVVGYDIPALRLNYEDHPELHLAPEGDVEALAQKVVELLERSGRVEGAEPPFKTWRRIALEELAVIRRLAET